MTLFFSLAIFLFLVAMRTGDRRVYVAAAVAMGLTIDTKLNGVLVLPIAALMYASDVYLTKKSIVPEGYADVSPGIYCHRGPATRCAVMALALGRFWARSSTDPLKPLTMTLSHWSYIPEEYFLGVYQPCRIYYLPVYFLVTTPLLVLALCAVGCYYTVKGRDPDTA